MIQFTSEQMQQLIDAREVLGRIAPSGFEARVWRDREGVRINGSMEVLSFLSQDLYREDQRAFVTAVSTVLNIVQLGHTQPVPADRRGVEDDADGR